VAIQDAMSWLDYHLHEFRLTDPSGTLLSIGIPTDEQSPDRRPSATPEERPAPNGAASMFA